MPADTLVAPTQRRPDAAALAAVLSPGLLGALFPAGPRQQLDREARIEQHDQRRRRRDTDVHQALAASLAAPGPAETIIRAERGMLPGSQAARSDQLDARQQKDAATRQQGSFRAALRQASTEQGVQSAPRTTATGPTAIAGRPTAGVDTPAPVSSTTESEVVAAPPSRAPSAAASPSPSSPATAQPAVRSAAPNAPSPTVTPAVTHGTAKSDATPAPTQRANVPPPTAAGVAPTAATRGTAPAERPPPATMPLSQSAPGPSSARTTTLAARAAATTDVAGKTDATIERIVRLLQSRVGREQSVATLRLDPPELGMIRLHMHLRAEQVSLRVEATTPAARRLLLDDLDALRRGLEAAGLRLESVDVRLVARDAPESPGPTSHAGQSQTHPDSPDRQGDQAPPDTPTTDRGPAPPGAAASDESSPPPAAESLVNLWA